MAAPTFIRIRVSPAKAAISSDRVIAEELTGAWLPCQESSAFQWSARSNYPLKTEYLRLHFQNPRSDRRSRASLQRRRERRLGLVQASATSSLGPSARDS